MLVGEVDEGGLKRGDWRGSVSVGAAPPASGEGGDANRTILGFRRVNRRGAGSLGRGVKALPFAGPAGCDCTGVQVTVCRTIVDHIRLRGVVSPPHDGIGTSNQFYRMRLIETNPVK